MRAPRLPLLLTLCAPALLTSALVAPAAAREELVGELPPAVELSAGAFRVAWDPSEGGALSVRAGQRVAWSSRRGQAFVGARLAELRVGGSRGFFDLHERVRARWTVHGLDAIASEEGAVVLRGRLFPRAGRGVTGVLEGEQQSDPGQLVPAFTLRFLPVDAHTLRFELSVEPADAVSAVELIGESDPQERFLGFGEQFTFLDHKGRRVPIVVQEQGIGRGRQPVSGFLGLVGGAGGDWSTTYAPVPFTLTTRLRALGLEEGAVSFFDLTDPRALRVELLAPRMRGRMIAGDSPLELIEAWTAWAGRMRPLPDWVHAGLIVGATGGPERIRALADTLARHDVPVAGFFLQDWVGERETPFGTRLWWHWQADQGTYPDWPGFVRELRGRGLQVMAYVNPFLVEQRPGAPRDLWGEAREGGFLVRNADGQPVRIGQAGFSAGLVDLTDPAARTWLKELIKSELLGSGVRGWMGDFGEALPFDARLAEGAAPEQHNRWPELWQSLQAEAVAEAGLQDEVVFFSRSAYTRSPGATRLLWLGDQLCSWDRHDGLKSALTGLITGGLSGFSLNHGDAGGYTNIRVGPLVFFRRTKELLLRWLELMAFSAVLRTHEGLVPGARGGHGIDSDEDTLRQVARTSKLFRALQPYRRQLMQEAAARGWPLVRHPWLQDPTDRELLASQRAFLLGADLLVAPVVDPGRDTVEVRLPRGRWVSIWTDQVYGDPERSVELRLPAPLGRPAALYRAGAAMGPALVEALVREGLRGDVGK